MQNLEISQLKNKKRNSYTAGLRYKVMECIYELRKVKHFPRIYVRVTEDDVNGRCLGVAHTQIKAIWITEGAIMNYSHEALFAIVAHEVLHTAFGIEHDETCPLMSSYKKPITKAETIKRFKAWAGKSK
jgi:hypothetical protein